jgi:hypothetical protein
MCGKISRTRVSRGAALPAIAITAFVLAACAEQWRAEQWSGNQHSGNQQSANQHVPGEPALGKPTPAPEDVFAVIASDLLSGIDVAQKIAIQPYRAEDVPVPLTLAQSFNDSLARAIETKVGTRDIIVARQELPRLFAETEEFGEAIDTPRLLEAARADVLVIGVVTPASGGVDISYKAFDVRTGRQLSSAPPRFHAADVNAPRGTTLDQALAVAAAALSRQAPEMKKVETLGIYYQQSEVQPALGNYIGRELVGRLVESISGLQVMPAAILGPDLQNVERLEKGGTEELMIRANQGTYLLSGTMWDFGVDIEVRFTLRGAGGRVASHSARIRRDSIPVSFFPIAPSAPLLERREHLGPFSLQLSSNRGQRPIYTIGNAASLIVQSTRDGYLYCYDQASPAAGGGITQIFPNQYNRDARIRGGMSVHIPGKGMNFEFLVQGPPGVEYVRCFMLDRDASVSLPQFTRAPDQEPLTVPSLDDLGRIFRTLPATQISEATLVMTIEAPR